MHFPQLFYISRPYMFVHSLPLAHLYNSLPFRKLNEVQCVVLWAGCCRLCAVIRRYKADNITQYHARCLCYSHHNTTRALELSNVSSNSWFRHTWTVPLVRAKHGEHLHVVGPICPLAQYAPYAHTCFNPTSTQEQSWCGNIMQWNLNFLEMEGCFMFFENGRQH